MSALESGTLALPLGAVLALVSTLALIAFLRLLRRAYDAATPRVEGAIKRLVPDASVQGVELLPSEDIRSALIALFRSSRYLFVVAAFYAYAPLLLSLFPWTRPHAYALLGHLIAPLKAFAAAAAASVPGFFFIAVALFIARYASMALGVLFAEVGRGRVVLPGFHRDWAEPTIQIIRFAVWTFTAIAIFPYLPGSGSPAFKGISVFLGLLISLGSGSVVANALSGLIITYMRPFLDGDRVKIAGSEGDVIERGLLATRLRTNKNVTITIPNSVVLGGHIENFSAGGKDAPLILHTTVTIGYDAPWRKVHELLLAAARDTPGILAEPAPFVLQTALGDFSVAYELNAHTDRPNAKARTYSELHTRIQDRFAEAGLEIMSPVFEVHRAGPTSTVPPRPA